MPLDSHVALRLLDDLHMSNDKVSDKNSNTETDFGRFSLLSEQKEQCNGNL